MSETLSPQEPTVPDEELVVEEYDELPPRPRRRLLAPVPVALLGLLLVACGFIGGVLVEKGQTSSSTGSSAAAGLASRFAALRGAGAAGSTNGGTSASGAGGSATGSGFAGRLGGFAGAGGATIGEVSYISGHTLYVTDAEGNTVKVTTSTASSITKTVKAGLHGIHPGETVVVRGAKGSGGAVRAESISVGGAAGGGLAALFGGGGGRGAGAAGGSGSAGGGGPALFGG
ncbi:MAG: hypothetical protein ACRDLF_09135 [Solirubrobacteraceae bacterium]